MTKTATIQQNQNHRAIQQQEYTGIMGGSDSFTIIGNSGIGKSSAISRSLSLLQADGIIETQKPYAKIIPCVVVQCPFDSSVKGLLLEILRKVDEVLETDYYKNALKIRVTTDMLIGSVSQVAINHIGLLVVDEIQNVVNSKHGKSLVGMLTQLINNSGISICTGNKFEFVISDVSVCADEMGISEEMLGYILALFDEYSADVNFEDNTCHFSLTVKKYDSVLDD